MPNNQTVNGEMREDRQAGGRAGEQAGPEQCSIRALNRSSDTAPSVVNGSPSASTPLEALSPLPDITAPPEATAPPKAAKGKATKTTKASTQARASKLSAEPTLPDANTTTVATTVIPTPEQVVIATLPSVADTTLTSDQGVAWESLPFPLLPPDLNYLNDPASAKVVPREHWYDAPAQPPEGAELDRKRPR